MRFRRDRRRCRADSANRPRNSAGGTCLASLLPFKPPRLVTVRTAQRLQLVVMAFVAVVEQRRVRRTLLDRGFGVMTDSNSKRISIHSDETTHIEVDLEGTQHFDGASVLGSVHHDGVQHDADRQFVAKGGFGTICTVFRKHHFRMVATQHGEVGAGHTEQTTVAERLHGTVEEDTARSIGIEIDHIEAVIGGVAILVHYHRRIGLINRRGKKYAWLGTTRSEVILL